jgi:hypothetical protein
MEQQRVKKIKFIGLILLGFFIFAFIANSLVFIFFERTFAEFNKNCLAGKVVQLQDHRFILRQGDGDKIIEFENATIIKGGNGKEELKENSFVFVISDPSEKAENGKEILQARIIRVFGGSFGPFLKRQR